MKAVLFVGFSCCILASPAQARADGPPQPAETQALRDASGGAGSGQSRGNRRARPAGQTSAQPATSDQPPTTSTAQTGTPPADPAVENAQIEAENAQIQQMEAEAQQLEQELQGLENGPGR